MDTFFFNGLLVLSIVTHFRFEILRLSYFRLCIFSVFCNHSWPKRLMKWKFVGLFLNPDIFRDRRRHILTIADDNTKIGHVWDVGGLSFCNGTSDSPETGQVTHWGSGLSIWIETGLWKQGVSFLEKSEIRGREGSIRVFWRAFIL